MTSQGRAQRSEVQFHRYCSQHMWHGNESGLITYYQC